MGMKKKLLTQFWALFLDATWDKNQLERIKGFFKNYWERVNAFVKKIVYLHVL